MPCQFAWDGNGLIMPLDRATRKRVELIAKLETLSQEFQVWRQLSGPGAPLEKHNSQVQLITAQISAMSDVSQQALLDPGFDDQTNSRHLEEKVLAIHLMWDFFRSKFSLRLNPWFSSHLRACDEFAWKCYVGAREAFLSQHARNQNQTPIRVKEPPLVFLNGGWSPFAVSRRSAFRAEYWAERWPAGAKLEFSEALENFCVPLIGVPWLQVAHLPDALVIGHEMGHVVEWDFGLGPEVEDAFLAAGIEARRIAAWNSWRQEVFADFYGCLAGGPGFVTSMLDFLAGGVSEPAGLADRAGDWGKYPFLWLRIYLMLGALGQMGFNSDAKRLRTEWESRYGSLEVEEGYISDANGIVGALLKHRFKALDQKKLVDILPPVSLQAVPTAASNFLITQTLDDPNPRIGFAVSSWVHGNLIDPTFKLRAKYFKAIREYIVDHVPVGVRGTEPADVIGAAELEKKLGIAMIEGMF